MDGGNLECGLGNPVIWMTWVSSVADLGIKVMGPQVMSNFAQHVTEIVFRLNPLKRQLWVP